MDYKEFVTKVFACNQVKKITDNEFILILPTKYRFAESRTRINVLVKEKTIVLNDMGNTIKHLKSYYSDIEKYQKAIEYICKIEDITFKNDVFEIEINQNGEMERDLFGFVHSLHLIANIKTLDKANNDNF